jgi:hypothetical protein
MAAPAGSESQVGFRYAKGVDSFGSDIWTPVVNNFFRAKSMSGIVAKRKMERVANMDPSNQVLKGNPVEAAIVPKFSLNPDADSLSRLLAHFLSKSPTISTPSGGVTSRQWVMTPFEAGDTPSATYIDSLSVEASDNDGNPILISGARMQDFTLKIQHGKIIDCELGFLACHDTYTSDQTTILAATYTGKPIVRGHWATANMASTFKIKVTATAGGGFDGTVKCTKASYAGTTTIQIKFDTWYRVTLDDGSRLGVDRFDDVWFCFPASGGTLLAANDEFSWTATRTLPAASYSTLDALQAGGLDFSVGGANYWVHDAEVKISRPRSANFVAGSKYALSVQKNGPIDVQITINRDRDDRDFLKKLIDASSFAVTAKLYGNPIEGSIDQLLQLDFPNAQVSDVTRDVTTPNTLQEKAVIQPYRTGSSRIVTVTTIGTLTAL